MAGPGWARNDARPVSRPVKSASAMSRGFTDAHSGELRAENDHLSRLLLEVNGERAPAMLRASPPRWKRRHTSGRRSRDRVSTIGRGWTRCFVWWRLAAVSPRAKPGCGRATRWNLSSNVEDSRGLKRYRDVISQVGHGRPPSTRWEALGAGFGGPVSPNVAAAASTNIAFNHLLPRRPPAGDCRPADSFIAGANPGPAARWAAVCTGATLWRAIALTYAGSCKQGRVRSGTSDGTATHAARGRGYLTDTARVRGLSARDSAGVTRWIRRVIDGKDPVPAGASPVAPGRFPQA